MRKLGIVALILLALLIVADRVSPLVAAGVVAKEVRSQADLTSTPDVTFHGFPFLTQALAGRYGDVEVKAKDVDVEDLHGVDIDSHFHGLHASLGDAIGGNLDTIPVDRVTGTATVSYAELLASGGLPRNVHIDSITHDGDGVRIHASTTALGIPLSGSAHASVRVDDDALVITAQKVTLDDPPPGVDGSALPAGSLGFSVSMKGLPFGLHVTDVRVGDHGVGVSAEAEHVVLG